MSELRYDLVIVLDYYAPYVSGLTETARAVAVDLAAEGLRVAVVAGRHDARLPLRERIDGVDVYRARVWGRLSKAIIAPGMAVLVRRLAARARVVQFHLPLPEAGFLAPLVGRTPVMVTYHCDVAPPGAVGRLIRAAVDASSRAAIRRASRVVVTTRDYADHSRLARSLAAARLVEIAPPALDRSGGRPRFRDGTGRHVGFLGRVVAEKGLEHLVAAFSAGDDPDDRLLIAGDYGRVAGGSVMPALRAAIEEDPRIRVLGFVPDADLADFYASLDVFALPSVNSFEAFGIVQVEAMLCGVPVVASDLPGVRVPVRETGLGVIVPVGDREAIADALDAVGRLEPAVLRAGLRRARARYAPGSTTAAYRALLDRMS